jgi:glycosyltransferase involved in cell wall biosynthesis
MPVSFLGHVDPADFFSKIDVLMAPTIWSEPFGLTVVESLSMGVPVLGAAIGGTREILAEFNPEWLLAVGDTQAWAERMKFFIEQGRTSLSIDGNIRGILHRTSRDFVVDRYLDTYRGTGTHS